MTASKEASMRLRLIRALGRELAPVEAEVAVQDVEVDDPLVGGQALVGGRDDPAEIFPGVLLGLQSQALGQDLVAPVRHDEQDVIRPAVADEESPLDPRHAGELVLDLARRDGLAAVVLVDVLDPVDDLVVAVGLPLEDVAGREPVVLLRIAPGIGDRVAGPFVLEIPGDVVPRDLELAVGAEAGLQAGQGQAVGAVDVAPRRGHGDAPGPLRHAEAAHQLDAVAREEAEDARVEISRRREPPRHARPDDLADDSRRVGPGRRGVDPLQAALVELGPAHRDADEAGRPDPGSSANRVSAEGFPAKT